MKKLFWMVVILAAIGLFGQSLPEERVMPVQGATVRDWHPQSFWFYPWGRNRIHRGIDIFAKTNTPVYSAGDGLVLYQGYDSLGGNVAVVLGAKWRIHYYAHMNSTQVKSWSWVKAGQTIGAVGDSGNAKGKQPHLHYSIRSLYPRWWAYNPQQRQAWNHMFYLDPGKFLTQAHYAQDNVL